MSFSIKKNFKLIHKDLTPKIIHLTLILDSSRKIWFYKCNILPVWVWTVTNAPFQDEGLHLSYLESLISLILSDLSQKIPTGLSNASSSSQNCLSRL